MEVVSNISFEVAEVNPRLEHTHCAGRDPRRVPEEGCPPDRRNFAMVYPGHSMSSHSPTAGGKKSLATLEGALFSGTVFSRSCSCFPNFYRGCDEKVVRVGEGLGRRHVA